MYRLHRPPIFDSLKLAIMIGIDDLAFYVPSFCLEIETLSQQRNIAFEKLNKGLGLSKMAIPNLNEDAATMAANAVKQLIERNKIPLEKIGRIYVGTESAFDGAKPIASYVLGMLEDYFDAGDKMRHCDCVDMTFACIGGVDAFLNTCDWVRADEDRIGIVVNTDNAKYGLNSPGEYTQGAGAVAILIKSNPRLMSIAPKVGVACKSEHDFFKPLRKLYEYLEEERQYVKLHDVTPIYDGHFSNACYADRVREAFDHFKAQTNTAPITTWQRLIFHLPYAFHAKRIFAEIFMLENDLRDESLSYNDNVKAIYKSEAYRNYINKTIERGQRASSEIGNMYTASIWMALISTLSLDVQEGNELTHQKIGFCSYGSGSKAKVFEGKLQPTWQAVAQQWQVFETLAARTAINFSDYENLHNEVGQPLEDSEGKFVLNTIQEAPLYGVREYAFQ